MSTTYYNCHSSGRCCHSNGNVAPTTNITLITAGVNSSTTTTTSRKRHLPTHALHVFLTAALSIAAVTTQVHALTTPPPLQSHTRASALHHPFTKPNTNKNIRQYYSNDHDYYRNAGSAVLDASQYFRPPPTTNFSTNKSNLSNLKQNQETSSLTDDDIIKLQNVRKEYQQSKSSSSSNSNNNADYYYSSVPANNDNTETIMPLLTREQELMYSFRIRTMRAALRLREQLVVQQQRISSNDDDDSEASFLYVHPTEREWAKACGTTRRELRRLLEQGQDARRVMVSANAGLVNSIARKQYYTLKQAAQAGGGVGTILTLQDLVQEGNLGLMEAAERFEPGKGFRFSAYATWWIRQRILKSVSDSSRTIRLPAHVHSTLHKISRMRQQLAGQEGRQVSEEELAQALDMSIQKLQQYTHSSRNVLSLERPITPASTSIQDNRITLADTLASDGPTPQEAAEILALKRDVNHVLQHELAEMERDVVEHRFGLHDGNPRSVQETAELLGLTRDRVRLVEARALHKLRHSQRNDQLQQYIQNSSSRTTSTPKSTQPAPFVRVTNNSFTVTATTNMNSDDEMSNFLTIKTSLRARRHATMKRLATRGLSTTTRDNGQQLVISPTLQDDSSPDRFWFF